MTDIVIQGIYGRMGRALIEKIAARQDCRVVAGVDREAGKVGDIPVYAGFEGLPKVDAIIDFSSPAGAVAAVQYGAVHGVPCVICSTGLSAEDETVLEDASAKTPIFRSANMSLGVNVLIELARQATRVLSGEFDIEIVEKHHHNKLDAPSGTALMIADAINAEAGNSYEYVYDRSQVRQKRVGPAGRTGRWLSQNARQLRAAPGIPPGSADGLQHKAAQACQIQCPQPRSKTLQRCRMQGIIH